MEAQFHFSRGETAAKQPRRLAIERRESEAELPGWRHCGRLVDREVFACRAVRLS
jgi:hypothetical protein